MESVDCKGFKSMQRNQQFLQPTFMNSEQGGVQGDNTQILKTNLNSVLPTAKRYTTVDLFCRAVSVSSHVKQIRSTCIKMRQAQRPQTNYLECK